MRTPLAARELEILSATKGRQCPEVPGGGFAALHAQGKAVLDSRSRARLARHRSVSQASLLYLLCKSQR